MDSAVVPGKSGRNLGLWLGSGWGGGGGTAEQGVHLRDVCLVELTRRGDWPGLQGGR